MGHLERTLGWGGDEAIRRKVPGGEVGSCPQHRGGLSHPSPHSALPIPKPSIRVPGPGPAWHTCCCESSKQAADQRRG